MPYSDLPKEMTEIIAIYDEIITKLADLFYHLGIDDDVIKIYEYFRYMYTNGYLSYKKNILKILKLVYVCLNKKILFQWMSLEV